MWRALTVEAKREVFGDGPTAGGRHSAAVHTRVDLTQGVGLQGFDATV